MSGLTFHYGTYAHPEGEVYPRSIEATPLFTSENVRWGTAVRYDIAGDFCADPGTPLTPALLTTKIDALDLAYNEDYKDFGFKVDGVESAHWSDNDDTFNLSGNRVLSRSWVHRGPNEYANTRSFAVSLGFTYQNNYSQIVYFKERVRRVGNGGAMWTYRPNWSGAPRRVDIHAQTPVQVVQEGVIIGLNVRPTAPLPYWPDDQFGPEEMVQLESPTFHGHLNFDRPTHYPLRYRYRFLMASNPATDDLIDWPT